MINENTPKVSICVVTYNQKDYIADCLQSLIDQKTNISYEIIVCDDSSTDGTSDIVRNFQLNYPSLIRAFLHTHNLGPMDNYMFAHSKARGEYVAHMDGDDYAIQGKIQTQADVLDRMPEISFVAHDTKIIGTTSLFSRNIAYKPINTILDLFKYGTFFTHSSIMYRAKARRDWISFDVIDYGFYVHLFSKGNLYYINKIYGAHRFHSEGISKDPKYLDMLYNGYMAAFEYALEIGYPKRETMLAKMNFRYANAMYALIECDSFDKFKRAIKIRRSEMFYTTTLHKILFILAFMPWAKSTIVSAVLRYRQIFTNLNSYSHK